MKKFVLFSLMLGLVCIPTVVSAATCGQQNLRTAGWPQEPGDDEFLYTSKAAREKAMKDFEDTSEEAKKKDPTGQMRTPKEIIQNTTTYKISKGWFLECDEQVCLNGTLVYLPNADWGLDGVDVAAAGSWYICRTGGNDYWEKKTYGKCSEGVFVNQELVKYEHAKKVYRATDNGVSEYKHPLFYRKDRADAICVCDKGLDSKGNCKSGKKQDKDPKDPVKPAKTCAELYPNNAKAIACCESKEADWKPYIGGNPGDGMCKCKDEAKEWDENKKQCVVKENEEELSNCYIRLSMDIKCADGIHGLYSNKIYPLSKEQVAQIGRCPGELLINGNVNVDSIMSSYISSLTAEQKALRLLLEQVCPPVIVPAVPNDEVNNALKLLSAFTSSAESNASGWRTADGKFNTTRLASDISAGVVLGTVGGVVSGVVIKKKQVEKGFDALHCTVGGQTIANWGDTFSVGLQK